MFFFYRFVVVYFPLKRMAYCTRSRAVKVLVSLLILSLLVYSYCLWTTGAIRFPYGKHVECRVKEEYLNLVYIMSLVDSVLTMILPTLIIVIFNILIACRIRQFLLRRRRNSLSRGESQLQTYPLQTRVLLVPGSAKTTNSDMKTKVTTTESVQHTNLSNKYQLRTTQTLLTISSLFVLLNLPSHAFRMWATIHPQGDLPQEWLLLLQLIFQFLYYLNFSCNLFMYCLCHRVFRKVVISYLRSLGHTLYRALVG